MRGKMSYKLLISTFMLTLAQAQLNGEFWWLNSKLNSIKKISPIPPKIDISDFQDDDSSKIIFRDDDFSNKLKPISDRTSKIIPVNNLNDKIFLWPTEEHMKNHDVEVEKFTTKVKEEEENVKPFKLQSKHEDVLVFSYPKAEELITIDKSQPSTGLPVISSLNKSESSESSGAIINAYTSKLQTFPTTTKETESQNICTYTTKKKCNKFDGVVYEYANRIPATYGNEPLICCILPIQPLLNENKLSHTVHFPQTSNLNRYKRSDSEANISSQQQRIFLIKHRFTPQRNTKPVSIPLTKIVTSDEDDYADPYWNIKNSKFQPPFKLEITKHVDYSDSEEYADEVPKPGLIGLYSDHAPSPSNWPFQKGHKGYGVSYDDYEDDEDEEDDKDDEEENTFGYSTIDPRRGSNKQIHKVKPQKIATTSDKLSHDAERHTINFQSDPDFHVFQGFKLLNLFRDTSRVHTKQTSNQDTDVLVSAPDNSEEEDEVFDEHQLFVGCGTVIKKINDNGNQIGEAPSGTQPWLALVVLTKSRHNILCYATLVHTRAAITVADCVEGTGPGEVTVIAGLWDLKDKSRGKSRVASLHIHPQHSPGEAENNLAILYWLRPLKLSAYIQPACLGQPQYGDECKLFGWGTLHEGIEYTRPRWQRATARACSTRVGNKRARSPSDPFCLSTSPGTVTGIGGPLICDVARHSSIAGVVVSRNGGYILSPVRDWAKKMDFLITGD